MSKTPKEKLDELREDNPLARKILKSPRALRLYFQLFKNLCPICKEMVVQNPKTTLDKYCPLCKEMAEEKLKKIQEILQ